MSECNGSCAVSTKNESLTFNRPPYMYFCLFPQVVLLNDVYLPKFYQHTNIHRPTVTGENFTPSQNFERTPFWNSWRCEIKNYIAEVIFNDMISPLNLIKSTDWFKR
jgi:hypothetical protein